MSFTIAFLTAPPVPLQQKTPSLFIPAYVKQDVPAAPPQTKQQPEPLTDKLSLEKPTPPNEKTPSQPNQQLAAKKTPEDDPVHLIGNTKAEQKSLMVVLGKALTKKLIYPKVAVDFMIRGRALIGFVVHPDGEITDVELLISSGTGVLDEAALNAARNMSPVKKAGEYVTLPQYVRIGVFFG